MPSSDCNSPTQRKRPKTAGNLHTKSHNLRMWDRMKYIPVDEIQTTSSSAPSHRRHVLCGLRRSLRTRTTSSKCGGLYCAIARRVDAGGLEPSRYSHRARAERPDAG